MPVAIETTRFGKHKMYHIILQEVRKQSFDCRSSLIHNVTDKNKHFHLQNTPCANVWTGAKGLNRITLKVNRQKPRSALLRPIQKIPTPIKLPISPLPEMINQICKKYILENYQDKKTSDDTCDIFQKQPLKIN